MIFVDTSAWYALLIAGDANCAAARRWYGRNSETLLTTDYVADETLTLLKVRGEAERACRLGERLFAERVCRMEWVTRTDVAAAWDTFRGRRDKQWSFTDCVSKAVMERLGIGAAFAFDRHFQQFGTVTVVPQ